MAANPRHQSGSDDIRTPAQNRAIHRLWTDIAKAAGLDRSDIDPLIRDACRAVAGHEHTSKLTQRQAATVIGRLERELGKYSTPGQPVPAPHEPWGPRGPGKREDRPITAMQNVVIQGLFNLCATSGAGFDNFAKRRAFVQRQCKVDWPETQAHADALIEPLAAIALRKVDADDVKRRVLALRGRRELDTWKAGFIRDVAERFEGATSARSVLTPHRFAKILECEAAIAAAGEGA